jgi:hypothetical protein
MRVDNCPHIRFFPYFIKALLFRKQGGGRMNKDEIFTSIAVIVLLFTAFIDWSIYSWLILIGIIAIMVAWYFRRINKRQLVKN